MERLMKGNQQFRKRFAAEQERYLKLADEGQAPQILWICCSDSRVIPEEIVSAQAGELFVVRNIANVVPPVGNDEHAVGAAVEYAVLHLRVPHIIVCGHTQCGGIHALGEEIDPTQEPHIARWLTWARPAAERVQKSGVPSEEAYLATIKANVLLQLEHLLTYPSVRKATEAGRLQLHAWLYDLHTGELLAYDDKTDRWRPLG